MVYREPEQREKNTASQTAVGVRKKFKYSSQKKVPYNMIAERVYMLCGMGRIVSRDLQSPYGRKDTTGMCVAGAGRGWGPAREG